MGGGSSLISKHEMLGRLAQGHAAGMTVVTPNRRLAGALLGDFDAFQEQRGLACWEAADILPLQTLIERLYQDALYSDLATALPLLLSPAQEQALWEDIIGAGDSAKALPSIAPAAALAREAWKLAASWRLGADLQNVPANDDAREFAAWAHRYSVLSKGERYTDGARLADVVAARLGHGALRTPGTIVAYGFDIVTPQQKDFLAALGKAQVEVLACGPPGRAGRACRISFTSAKDEFRAAASWARARLEANPSASIGIVVPDLAKSRGSVQRIFARVMEPAHLLPGGDKRPLPFDLSLGEPLAAQPLVEAALLALDLARAASAGEAEFARASRLIRSPFIAGSETELADRARLDAELRKFTTPGIDLGQLLRAIARHTGAGNYRTAPACPILANRLAEFARLARKNLAGSRRPSEWAKTLIALLGALGFPGERGLDSIEYQTLGKWHELLCDFASLDRVSGRLRVGDARARLSRMAADTVFQPEAPEAPIRILGLLESAGLEFDHLWVTGLSDKAWPLAVHPNPLIAPWLQRRAGVPEASAAVALELDRRITQGWLSAAGEVVISHPLREEDEELSASPLIRVVPEAGMADLALPQYPTLREVIRRARREDRAPDSRGPSLPRGRASAGGTAVFRDQAACPFKAFASHRLSAEALEAPSPGIDARERGTLLHDMLARVWSELKSKARLDAVSARDLDALLAAAADSAIGRLRRFRADAIKGRFAELERARLIRLGRAWLELEKARNPFEVASIETKRAVKFGGLIVNAKLDRMDRLEGGVHAILDYKTGVANVADWLGPRPDEPQLPLYAISGSEDIAAVAIARVKAGEMAFKGIARTQGLISGIGTLAEQRTKAAKRYASWDDLLAGWRGELDALGREFAAGEARVDPKRGEETCARCDFHPLCRINERAALRFDGSGTVEGSEDPPQ